MITDMKHLSIEEFVDQYATDEVKDMFNSMITDLHNSFYEHYKFLHGSSRFTIAVYEEVKLKNGKNYTISCFWTFEGMHNDEPMVIFDHYSPASSDSVKLYVDFNDDEGDEENFIIDISDAVDEWNHYYYDGAKGTEPKPILP